MSAIITTTVQRIQTLAGELDQLGKTALEKAMEAGGLLIECKRDLEHGQWLPWLEANFSFTDRTARRWMKLVDDVESGKLKSDTVSNLADAYRLTTDRGPGVVISPFEMPPIHQRMFLMFSEISSPDFAMFEPIDEDYINVTFTDLHTGKIAGSKRGIRRDRAWSFLTRVSDRPWAEAGVGYIPWEPTGTARNHNLTDEDPTAWIPENLEAAKSGAAQ
jgi:hypothetical protein